MNTAKADPAATLRLRRTYKAPVARVYRAWTEPALMSKWFGCEQVTAINVTHDFKVGGQYQIEMVCGDVSHFVTGTYKEIVPNKKLSYTWTSDFPEVGAKDSLVSVQFIEQGESTEVILDHTEFSSQISVDSHTEGWTYAMQNLEALLAEAA